MSNKLPKEFVDAHHHFICTSSNGSTFHKFMNKLIPNFSYVAKDYQRDVIVPLQNAGIKFGVSVHMECIPDNGLLEVQWITSSFINPPSSDSSIKCIIASCDLSQDISVVESELQTLSEIKYVKGVRWILDCVGKFDSGKTATHIATTRHDGIDYLRGSDGGYEGHAIAEFERGFASLEKYNFTFDLQCAPAQLLAASKLCAKYPKINVVIDHMGKPRSLLGADTEENRNNLTPDEAELTVWREGMKSLAQNKNVYVKISMLGYIIPGWIRTKERLALMRSLVRETVEMFGPERCMIASNYWKDASMSDSDGMSDVGPDVVRLLELLYEFLKDYSDHDLDHIFSRTASKFYNL
jgi:predicted TIM-barrel fold metal-dependent hydrolase